MRKTTVLLLFLAAFLSIAATSAFYIIDSDGDRIPLGTSGSLKFPNITGTANNVEVVFDHADLLNRGTQPHSAIDSHLLDSSVHFEQAAIDHANLIGAAGFRNHSAIEAHIDDAARHFLIDDAAVSSSSVWSSTRSSNELTLKSEFSVRGFTDSAYIAAATYGPSGWWSNSAFSLYGVVAPTNLGRTESFYRHLTADVFANIIDVGKNAANQLYVSIGANTYTSGVVFTAETIGMPVEVGVVCDQTGGNLWFFFNGEVFSSQAATYTFPTIPAEVHGLGYNFIGDIYSWFITKSLIFPAESNHTPVSEGLAQCRGCLAHYDMDTSWGGTVQDRYGMIRNNYPRNLNMSGFWINQVLGYK